jgi:hypothetical protein
MQEIKKDLFECISDTDVDAICIPTTGNYTRNGLAIMSDESACEAARRWAEVPKRLGKMLRTFLSNIPFVIGVVDENGNHLELTDKLVKERQFKCLIFSFPTIHNIANGTNIQLIKQSATIMVDYANQYNLKKIVLPRPGGWLWKDVKPEIEGILDDRFVVVSLNHEE